MMIKLGIAIKRAKDLLPGDRYVSWFNNAALEGIEPAAVTCAEIVGDPSSGSEMIEVKLEDQRELKFHPEHFIYISVED